MLKTLLSLISPTQWQVSSNTEVGPNRSHNEDSIKIQNQGKLKVAIVCDGVGGNNAGEVASAMCCQLITEQLAQIPASKINKPELKALIKKIHQQIVNKGNESTHTKGMATTLVSYIQSGQQHFIAWAGDSRAYIMHQKQLNQITTDHSFVAEKVSQGIFTPEEAEAHPMASMITSSIGGTQNSLRHIGITQISPKKGDKMILLSDGVYGFISPDQIATAAQTSATAITQLAINANTSDNCSAIVITIL